MTAAKSNTKNHDDLKNNQSSTRTDSFVMWPSLALLILIVGDLGFVYREERELFLLIAIAFLFFSTIYGVIKIFRRQFKKGMSYIFPLFVFKVCFIPELRLHELDSRHRLQFFLHQKKYESEITETSAYKEWLWGRTGGNEYHLVYDKSDAIKDSASINPCSRRVVTLEPHFYAVEDFCP